MISQNNNSLLRKKNQHACIFMFFVMDPRKLIKVKSQGTNLF